MKRNFKLGGLLLAAALAIVAATANPVCAQTYTYNPTAAATYAATNWNSRVVRYGIENPFTDYSYVTDGGNCTNFASQCCMAGLVGSYRPAVVFNNRRLF